VNRLVLSADGSQLSSTDRSQRFVSGTSIVSAEKRSAVMRIGDTLGQSKGAWAGLLPVGHYSSDGQQLCTL
jgi:hypothetical protein